MTEEMKKHSISLLVSNKPGVLIRIALVFARRGFNIDSLVVSEGNVPEFSRMTIAATGDNKTLDQIIKQLNKLVDVVHATDNTGKNIIERELALLKVFCAPEKRVDIFQLIKAFKGAAVDIADATIAFEVTGTSEKIDAVKKTFEPYGILEIVRTGKTLIARGDESTS
ncbi:MAG: acetolactate synthase small subunit [Spirochaetia bacterium]|jgi:acetolactate synthase-1/3 small subunit|nr:acetolactate synthase small subunit [Spirochaetia bacterium]